MVYIKGKRRKSKQIPIPLVTLLSHLKSSSSAVSDSKIVGTVFLKKIPDFALN
jgi:hypothetical protein